ncbi:MAG: hypothetical protein HGA33_03210 [Candidatus Moranbacteria bacterium]|nr:hypothetical protein [Candidatus Moranbacteria bacterium]
MLKLSNGDVSDLLAPDTVRSMYGACTLEQMIGYIEEARSARGGDLGIDFETSVFAKIVAHPDRHVSGEEIPYKWKDYFVVPPKKGRGAGRREDEVRGYLLAVKVEEYDTSHLSVANSRRYRKQVQGVQKLLRNKIREYRSTSDSAKRETLKADIVKNLKSLEQGLSLLGIPISDMEKGASRRDADEGGGVVSVGDARTQWRRAGRGPSKDSNKKRKIGIVAFKDDGCRRSPGRPIRRLTRDQELEKKSLEKRIRNLKLLIGRNEAILREKRSVASDKRKAVSDLGKANNELKEKKGLLVALLYGERISVTSAATDVASLSTDNGVGRAATGLVVERVKVDTGTPVKQSAQGGVVIPFPYVAPQLDDEAQGEDEGGVSTAQARERPVSYLQAVIRGNFATRILERMLEIREELLNLGYEFLGESSSFENAPKLDELIERRRTLKEELREGNSEFQKILKMMEKVF